MLTLQILTIAFLGAFAGLFFFQSRQKASPPEPSEGFVLALDALDDRMRRLELKWQVVQEELEDRLERGTHAFRKARQSEAYRRRREESGEDFEDEPEEMAEDVQQLDAWGGDPRGLQYMRPDLGNDSPPSWKALGESFAAHLAGRVE